MKRFVSIASSLILIVVLFGTLLFRQDAMDWMRLRGYTPPPEVETLARETTMQSGTRRLFYVQHPLVADKTTFNTYCRDNERTIVLGCYIQNKGIFLLDVTDERLEGVEQVTAAHELLHAAYDRLSGKEKSRINQLLEQTYDNIKDGRIRQTVELYHQQDPSVVSNELHSILGTEVRNLPAELEEYYKQYFVDRSKVVTYSEHYEQVFIDRRNQIREYEEQLSQLKPKIESLQEDLKKQLADLASQRNVMNGYKSNGQNKQYNDLVPSYNQKVVAYNRGVDQLQTMVTEYNDMVQKHNDIASEEAELVQAIDSREVVPQQQ